MNIEDDPDTLPGVGDPAARADDEVLPQTAVVARAPDELAWPLAFAEFYYQHFGGLVRMAVAMVDRSDVAEDVTQDALIALADRWDEVENPYAYAHRSVENACRDYLRHVRVQRVFRRKHRPETQVAAPPEIDETLDLLRDLSPRRRLALVLRYHEDLGYTEIAEVMGCRAATARSLVHRAIGQLRRRMSP